MRFDRSWLLGWARRLAAAAPSAFRHDPVFRYAAIGAVASFLVLIARLTGGPDRDASRPPEAPVSGALGSTYAETAVPGPPAGAALSPPLSIAPGRRLDDVRLAPNSAAPADGFGTVPSPRERP